MSGPIRIRWRGEDGTYGPTVELPAGSVEVELPATADRPALRVTVDIDGVDVSTPTPAAWLSAGVRRGSLPVWEEDFDDMYAAAAADLGLPPVACPESPTFGQQMVTGLKKFGDAIAAGDLSVLDGEVE